MSNQQARIVGRPAPEREGEAAPIGGSGVRHYGMVIGALEGKHSIGMVRCAHAKSE